MISYEELSLVFDMDNPLTLDYFELCSKDTDEPKYFHKHHILPKSMYPEYAKVAWNIVRLTYQNHYKVHAILAQICMSQEHTNKMSVAFGLMRKSSNSILDAETYDKLRRQHVTAISGENHYLYGKPMTEERRHLLLATRIGSKASDETKRKMSLCHKGKKLSTEHIDKIVLANTGRKASDETKAKLSAIRKGRKFTSEHKANISSSLMGEKHPQFGKCWTDEEKLKVSIPQRTPLPIFEAFLKSSTNLTLVGEYNGMGKTTKFLCDRGHDEFSRKPSHILEGRTCKYCKIEAKQIAVQTKEARND